METVSAADFIVAGAIFWMVVSIASLIIVGEITNS
jgi:hypothetical protein